MQEEFYKQKADDFLNNNPEFGTITKILGSGFNGVAFLTDKNLVVKATKDEEEFNTTEKIAKTINGIATPKYHKIEENDGLYMIVMDRVEPIKLNKKESDFLNMFRDGMEALLDSGEDISMLKHSLSRINNKKMETILGGVVDCVIALDKIGIRNVDIQEDNIGTINGRIVLFDVVDEQKELAESSIRSLRVFIREIFEGIDF